MSRQPRGLELPPPGPEAAALSHQLEQLIQAEIEADGVLPADRYWELALYHPRLGYYHNGLQKFGEGGDFVTAPELGPGFGGCVARWAAGLLDTLENPTLLELGAGSGALAAAVLTELDRLGAVPKRYLILEVSAELKARQLSTLSQLPAHLAGIVSFAEGPPDQPWEGVILGNEVVDALPPTRLRFEGGSWRELVVDIQDKRLCWKSGPPSTLGDGLPAHCRIPGYTTELQPRLTPWVKAVSEHLTRGALWLADYGYPGSEYYHAQRTAGTAIAHYRHRAHDQFLLWPGLNDLSVSVDFSALARAVDEAGLTVAGYTSQAQFLLGFGLADYAAEHGSDGSSAALAVLNEIKQLTLPGEMGDRFQILAATRDLEMPPWPVDQRYRL